MIGKELLEEELSLLCFLFTLRIFLGFLFTFSRELSELELHNIIYFFLLPPCLLVFFVLFGFGWGIGVGDEGEEELLDDETDDEEELEDERTLWAFFGNFFIFLRGGEDWLKEIR